MHTLLFTRNVRVRPRVRLSVTLMLSPGFARSASPSGASSSTRCVTGAPPGSSAISWKDPHGGRRDLVHRGPAALGPRVPLDVAASCLEALTPPNGPVTSHRKRHCSQSASVESQEPARRDTGIVIYPGPGPIGAVVAPAKAARSIPSSL